VTTSTRAVDMPGNKLSATYQAFTRQHFEQFDEHLSISQVDVQVLDAAADTHQM